jgi:hypothetical protein
MVVVGFAVLAAGIAFAAFKGWQAVVTDRRLWAPTRFSDLALGWRIVVIVLVAVGLVAGVWLGMQVS